MRRVFLSYRHRDETWKGRLLSELALIPELAVEIWHDGLTGSSRWAAEIDEAMATADAAICLLSHSYLESFFCTDVEMRRLITQLSDPARMVVIVLDDCNWHTLFEPGTVTAFPAGGRSLLADHAGTEDEVFRQVARWLEHLPAQRIRNGAGAAPAVHLKGFRRAETSLLGRARELEELDRAWDEFETRAVCVVADGGWGKTALISSWLVRMEDRGFAGAESVFAWTFSATAASAATGSDELLTALLDWLDPDSSELGLPWNRVEVATSLLRRRRTLLILDGLEAFQETEGPDRGEIRDPGLATLVLELCMAINGLFVVGSRLPLRHRDPAFLKPREIRLGNLAGAEEAQLLIQGGLAVASDDFEAALGLAGGHPLALRLAALASQLQALDRAKKSQRERQGAVEAIVGAIMDVLAGTPEGLALEATSIMRSPCAADEIAPVIDALTSAGERQRRRTRPESVLERLCDWALVESTPGTPVRYLPHSLVKEHVAGRLRRREPDAWRRAHEARYIQLTDRSAYLPETMEQMLLLHEAIGHGCSAGLRQAALDDVFYKRIQKGSESRNVHVFGAISTELATLEWFFDQPWTRLHPLRQEDADYVFNCTGYLLLCTGRLAEAASAMRLAQDAARGARRPSEVAVATINLAENAWLRGALDEGWETAEDAVSEADRSGDLRVRIVARGTLGEIQLARGDPKAAKRAFEEAEELEGRHWTQPYPFESLYSHHGIAYARLLLEQGESRDVTARALFARKVARDYGWLSDEGMAHQLLVDIAMAGSRPLTSAQLDDTKRRMDRAVKLLRRAPERYRLLGGYLTRARLYRTAELEFRAAADLDRVLVVARAQGLRLIEIDARLELAELHATTGRRASAEEQLAEATEGVRATGFAQRLPAIEKLAEALALS